MAIVRRDRSEWPDLFRRVFDADWDSDFMRVEEFRDGNTMVVRAELPGIDPDKDVELTVVDGVLHLEAHREEKSERKEKHSYRSEFRYGSFSRRIALPAGADESQVEASYTDGVLEVRVPMAEETKAQTTKI
ncbi:MAG: Hsp20/alpha crystallin family protein, partial [Acidimicrobiales bacterium]